MNLTDEEAVRAAHYLSQQTGVNWNDLSPTERVGYISLVEDLAKQIEVKHTPEALEVFMVWMGKEPNESKV
jgi:hypothetical protein